MTHPLSLLSARPVAVAVAVVTALVGLAGTMGCPASPATTGAAGEALVLRAYDVPAEHAAELQGIVAGLLWTGKDQPRKGAAALAPSGQLLVSAPAGFQPGIEEVIRHLKSAPAQRAPTVTLDYWIVAGVPAPVATKGTDVSIEIGDVVDAIEKSQGPMKLQLAERFKLSSQSGSEAQIDGSLMRASQTAALHGDKVVADVKLFGTRIQGGLESRVEIPLGQTVVLGQAGSVFGNAARIFVDDAVREQADKSGVTAFYIVRASVDAK